MEPARLRAFDLFADVADDDLAAISEAAKERIISEGEYVVHDGDFGYTVFFIEEGAVEVLKNGEVVAALGPGDVFGEVAVEHSGRRTADVRATAESRLIVVLNRDLWRIERRLPEIAEQMRATAKQRALRQKVVGRVELEQA
jgi:voltage-gated potassium channel